MYSRNTIGISNDDVESNTSVRHQVLLPYNFLRNIYFYLARTHPADQTPNEVLIMSLLQVQTSDNATNVENMTDGVPPASSPVSNVVNQVPLFDSFCSFSSQYVFA